MSNIGKLQGFVLAKSATTSYKAVPLTADGQTLIGSSSGDPIAATLTAGSNVSILNATNSITISAVGSATLGATNLGVSLSAGTFTVRGATAALSASNVAYVTVQSKTAGNVVTIPITANQTFIDDVGASTIIGNLFGMTTGVTVTKQIPFFIYAVLNDSENAISFMISRVPHCSVSPASGKIGKTGSAVASTQGSFFALGNPTVTDYDGNPCVLIGSFRMTMSNLNDWTVITLTNQDGVGKFQEGIQFDVPRGQFGAASAKHFANNGGTAPDDADGGYVYFIEKDGLVTGFFSYPALDTAGAGAVTAKLSVPFTCVNGGTIINGFFQQAIGPNTYSMTGDINPGASLTLTMRINQLATNGITANSSFSLNDVLSLNFKMVPDLV